MSDLLLILAAIAALGVGFLLTFVVVSAAVGAFLSLCEWLAGGGDRD